MVRAAFLALSFAALATPALAQQLQQAPPAVNTLNRQELRDEVTRLRGYVGNGAVRPQRPAGCVAPENREFDFWVGEWDVSPSGVQNPMVLAESSISLHAQGCVMEEYWRPFRGAHGHSINGYDPTDQHWHQYYIDATGTHTEFAGRFENGVLYLENRTAARATPATRQRMNFQRVDENTVRQWGERFDAATNAWTVTFDLTYRRRAGTAAPR